MKQADIVNSARRDYSSKHIAIIHSSIHKEIKNNQGRANSEISMLWNT